MYRPLPQLGRFCPDSTAASEQRQAREQQNLFNSVPNTGSIASFGMLRESRTPVDFTNCGTTELAGFPVAVQVPGMTNFDPLRVVRADGQEVIYAIEWRGRLRGCDGFALSRRSE